MLGFLQCHLNDGYTRDLPLMCLDFIRTRTYAHTYTRAHTFTHPHTPHTHTYTHHKHTQGPEDKRTNDQNLAPFVIVDAEGKPVGPVQDNDAGVWVWVWVWVWVCTCVHARAPVRACPFVGSCYAQHLQAADFKRMHVRRAHPLKAALHLGSTGYQKYFPLSVVDGVELRRCQTWVPSSFRINLSPHLLSAADFSRNGSGNVAVFDRLSQT